MATMNPFDLLGDDDAEDPTQLVAAQQKLAAAAKKALPAQPTKAGAQGQETKPAKLPSKPAPPAQAVREAKNEGGRGGSRGGGRGYGYNRGGRGGGGYNREEPANNDNRFTNSGVPAAQGAFEDGDGRQSERHGGYGGPRGGYRGGRRGGFGNGEGGDGERPRRTFERRSGTGRGSEVKREGFGRGNWGSEADGVSQVAEDVNVTDQNVADEKPAGEEDASDVNKETPANKTEEKEPEDKEMTLEEYEKVLEEKRKALQALKTTEERKVDTKEFETFQQLSNKKENNEIFIKLGSDKDKKKDAAEKEDKSKKSVSINEFLKPAEGERFYNSSGRERGRGRGTRQGFNTNNYSHSTVAAPSIADPGQFPTLGGK